MPGWLRRLFPGAALVVFTIVIVLGALVAGAQLAPKPLPSTSVALAQPLPPEANQPSASAPARHAVLGIIVAIGDSRIGVRTGSQAASLAVRIGARTALHLNGKPATLADYHVGDVIAAVGQPGPRGALLARTVMVVRRRGASPHTLLQQLSLRLTRLQATKPTA